MKTYNIKFKDDNSIEIKEHFIFLGKDYFYCGKIEEVDNYKTEFYFSCYTKVNRNYCILVMISEEDEVKALEKAMTAYTYYKLSN